MAPSVPATTVDAGVTGAAERVTFPSGVSRPRKPSPANQIVPSGPGASCPFAPAAARNRWHRLASHGVATATGAARPRAMEARRQARSMSLPNTSDESR
jgi:hypothetical protein